MLSKQRATTLSVSESAVGPDKQVNRAALLNPSKSSGPAKGPARATPRKRKQSSPGSKRSVLIVDDVPDVTEMIGLFLKHAGYEIATADSGSVALQLAKQRVFDVVISDIGMPQMNGCELAASLRRRAEYQKIPLIAVTGFSEYDNPELTRRAGFDAQLTKPIDPSELLRLIDRLLD